jgi:uncharacterized membrane protein YhiD involved in acid resistance
MRTLVIVALMATALALGGVARADLTDDRYAVTEDHYVDGFSHPLRIAAYVVAPIGFAAEWLIFRPFHYIVSRPQLSNVFNYKEGEDVDIRF